MGGLLGVATAEKDGLMSKYDSQTITKSTGYGPGTVVSIKDLPIGLSYLAQVVSEDFPSTSGCVIKFNFHATIFLFGWFGQFFVRCLRDGTDTMWQQIQTKPG